MKRGLHGAGALLALLAAVSTTGCESLSGAATGDFAYTYTCPPERVTIKERPDLRQPTHVSRSDPAPPPPDVQSDPERLAYYRELHPQHEWIVEDTQTYFEVAGCGHHTIYRCNPDRRHACHWYGADEERAPFVSQLQVWADTVCACPDAACASTARARFAASMPNDDVRATAWWVDAHAAAEKRVEDCYLRKKSGTSP